MIVPLVTGLRISDFYCEFSDFYFLWGTGFFKELGIAATFLDDNFDVEHDDKRWNGNWIPNFDTSPPTAMAVLGQLGQTYRRREILDGLLGTLAASILFSSTD